MPADGGPFLGFGQETSQVFTDVRHTGTLNPAGTTNNLLLLSARLNLSGNYVAGIAFADLPALGIKAGTLQITKVVLPQTFDVVQSSDASQGNQPPLTDLARSYFLQWDLVGNRQTARVFDHEGGTQLLVVHYTDTGVGGLAFTSGFAGVAAITTVGTLDGTFGPVGAAALTEWSYDFQTPPPPSFVMTSGTFAGPPSATASSSVAGGVLRLFDTIPPTQGGAFVVSAGETSVVFDDVRVSGIVNPTGTSNNLLNLLARFNLQASNAYAAGIDFSAGVLSVAKIVGGGGPVELVLSTDAGQGNQPPLKDLARSYFLQLDAVGNQLTARVFDVEGGTQLLIVNYTDTGVGGPPLTSGIAGVSALNLTGGLVDGNFGPVGAEPLP